jgi:hypothetical protein
MESPYRIPQPPRRTPDSDRMPSDDLSPILFNALCVLGFFVAAAAFVRVLAG